MSKKIDCSLVINYSKERKRMCDYYRLSIEQCSACPMHSQRNGHNTICYKMVDDYPQEAIDIIQKWSDEHPDKTILDDLLEKYPDAKRNSNGTPFICIKWLGYTDVVCQDSCMACWEMLLSEVKK